MELQSALAPTLIATALSVGVVHTLIGVDHALPFIVLGRAQRWSLRKTLIVTTLCGVGHVLSSVVIGAVGIALGVAVGRLESIESGRGELAAWLLIGFGLAYAAWGILRVVRGRTRRVTTAPSIGALFVIFVLGPCEVLIPLLMVPAATGHPGLIVAVVAVFGLATVVTMVTVVTLGYLGLRRPLFDALGDHLHTVAGLIIAVSGLGIRLLGI